ncbi:MAG: hypothetical protein NT076_04890, partial [Candidatus Pacearchaeota archaeon]|nr:hypothetical protein [Candidatus Pacearchaeota archaeon]
NIDISSKISKSLVPRDISDVSEIVEKKRKEGKLMDSEDFIRKLRGQPVKKKPEEVKVRIETAKKEIGKFIKKKPEEVKAGIETAKKEREKFVKKNPEEVVSFEQQAKDVEKLLEEKKKKEGLIDSENFISKLRKKFIK